MSPAHTTARLQKAKTREKTFPSLYVHVYSFPANLRRPSQWPKWPSVKRKLPPTSAPDMRNDSGEVHRAWLPVHDPNPGLKRITHECSDSNFAVRKTRSETDKCHLHKVRTQKENAAPTAVNAKKKIAADFYACMNGFGPVQTTLRGHQS